MKNQEENIKKALEAEVPQWNENLVWNQIEDELHPKKKKRFVFWLFFGIALLVTSVVTILIWEQKREIIEHSQQTSITEKKASKIPAQHTIKKALTSQSENLALNSLATNTTQVKQNIQNRTTTTTNEEQEIKSKTYSTILQKEVSSYSKLDEPRLALTTSETRNIFSPKAFNSNAHSSINKIKPLQLSSSLISFSPSYINFSTDINTSTVITPSKVQQKRKRNSIVLLAGLYQSYRQLSSISNPAWLSAKKVMDAPLETVDLSLNLRHFITNKFYVAGGIGLSQTVELMSSIDSTVTIELVPVDTAIILTDDFQSYYISGDLTQKTTQRRTSRTPNRYQAIYLPISLGYQFNKGRWGVQLNSGIDFELNRKFKGKILQYDGSVIPYKSDEQDYFDYSASIANLNFGTAINYNLSENLSLNVGATYKYGLFDYLSSEDHILRYNKLGMTVSAAYRM